KSAAAPPFLLSPHLSRPSHGLIRATQRSHSALRFSLFAFYSVPSCIVSHAAAPVRRRPDPRARPGPVAAYLGAASIRPAVGLPRGRDHAPARAPREHDGARRVVATALANASAAAGLEAAPPGRTG